MVSGIQLLGVFFALVQGYFTFLHFKRQEFTIREFFGWEVIWIGFGLVTLFPERFSLLAGRFGALRPLDLFTVFGFVLVLSISFYTYVNLDRMRKRMERIIRELALSEVHEEKEGVKK